MPDDLLVPITAIAAELEVAAQHLADRYANEILFDDINRRCLDKPTAARLIAAHQDAQQRAEAAKHARDEARHLRHQRTIDAQRAEQAARRARAERQRELVRDNPDVDATTLMRMANNDDAGLGAAGRRWDELARAERAGHVGVMHTFGGIKED